MQTIYKKKSKNLNKQEIQDILQNERNKVCFEHDMAHGDSKDLTRRTAFDKILHDKAFNIGENLKHDRYQKGLSLMVYKFFDKKASGSGINNKNMLNKAIIRKFNKRKVKSSFIDNIWGADLADTQLISKLNKIICLLEVKIFAHCLLLVTFYLLLVTFCSMLVTFSLLLSIFAHCLLLVVPCLLLFARCSLPIFRYFILVACYFLLVAQSFSSLLVTFCSLLVAFCSLLASFCS